MVHQQQQAAQRVLDSERTRTVQIEQCNSAIQDASSMQILSTPAKDSLELATALLHAYRHMSLHASLTACDVAWSFSFARRCWSSPAALSGVSSSVAGLALAGDDAAEGSGCAAAGSGSGAVLGSLLGRAVSSEVPLVAFTCIPEAQHMDMLRRRHT